MMAQLGRIESEFKRLSFDHDMNKVEIYDYFPINDDNSLREFLSNADGSFNEKRRQFEFMLYNAATKQKSQQKQFGEALKNLLFTRSYVSSHRWPNSRYKLIALIIKRI